jgi:hypothetical protein
MSSGERADDVQAGGGKARAQELLRAAPEPVALPDFATLEAELEREIAGEQGVRAELRALSTPRRYLLVLLPLCSLAGVMLLVRPRLDLAVYPPARMALVVSVVGALVLLSLLFALWSLAWPPVPEALRKLAVALAPISLFVLYALPPAHTAHPASLQAEGLSALIVRALPCLVAGSVVAASAFVLLRVFDRGATRAAWLFAACAGLYANLLLQLHCSVTAPGHMLLGHLGVVLLALLAVALLGRSGRDRG